MQQCLGSKTRIRQTTHKREESNPEGEGEPADALRGGEAVPLGAERKVRRLDSNIVERDHTADMQGRVAELVHISARHHGRARRRE
jgi:hypothetical protein